MRKNSTRDTLRGSKRNSDARTNVVIVLSEPFLNRRVWECESSPSKQQDQKNQCILECPSRKLREESENLKSGREVLTTSEKNSGKKELRFKEK